MLIVSIPTLYSENVQFKKPKIEFSVKFSKKTAFHDSTMYFLIIPKNTVITAISINLTYLLHL